MEKRDGDSLRKKARMHSPRGSCISLSLPAQAQEGSHDGGKMRALFIIRIELESSDSSRQRNTGKDPFKTHEWFRKTKGRAENKKA